MVADPFSKKYMILSYSFGDHSSHQSSTHPRLRSESAAKFVCRQELACAAPASAVAAAVQPASAESLSDDDEEDGGDGEGGDYLSDTEVYELF